MQCRRGEASFRRRSVVLPVSDLRSWRPVVPRHPAHGLRNGQHPTSALSIQSLRRRRSQQSLSSSHSPEPSDLAPTECMRTMDKQTASPIPSCRSFIPSYTKE